MPVEFVGMINTKDVSETRFAPGPPIDVDYTRRFIVAHEHAGFDKILINSGSPQPDGMQIAAYGAGVTERLGFLVSHRPGLPRPDARRAHARRRSTSSRAAASRSTSSPAAATPRWRATATTRSRTSATRAPTSTSTSSSSPGRRTSRSTTTAASTTSRTPGATCARRSRRASRSTSAARSDAAYRVGGKHADVYAFWGEPLAQTAEQIARVRAEAEAAGRTRPPAHQRLVPADPRADRGARVGARAPHPRARRRRTSRPRRRFGGRVKRFVPSGPPPNAGSQRLLAAAEAGELHDRCLWTPLAAATGAAGNSTALVGTPETVAQAILDYVDIGVTTHPDPRLRPLRGRHRLRPRAAPARARRGRPARRAPRPPSPSPPDSRRSHACPSSSSD